MSPNFEILVAEETWVFPESVRPLLSALSFWIGYSFDDLDWVAVENGLVTTNVEADQRFRYPLIGPKVPLEVSMALDPGAQPIFVAVWSQTPLPEILRIQIDTTLTIFNSFVDQH